MLTALDFVGHQRKEFRFDVRYRALTGRPAGACPSGGAGLPVPAVGQPDHSGPADAAAGPGEHPQPAQQPLADAGERTPQLRRHRPRRVPARVRGRIGRRRPVRPELDPVAPRLRPADPRAGSQREPALLKRVRSLAHVDDKDRAAAYRTVLADDAPAYAELSPAEQAFARMLLFSLWPERQVRVLRRRAGVAARRASRPGRDPLGHRPRLRQRPARHLRRRGPAARPESRGCTPATSGRRSLPLWDTRR